jgi:phage baseplate assembly protein V
MNASEKIAILEARLASLEAALLNSATRGVLLESDDAGGAQRQRVYGLYGEELTEVQLWQPFGLSANCPPGGDVMMLCLGGNRDGAQILAASHPDHRPTGQNPGETTIYDAGGQTVKLSQDGIAITDQFGSSITMSSGGKITIKATDVEITSDTLTNNGKDIGHLHQHLNSCGPGLGGVPK